ncbi:hypothetical protein ACFV97_02580 [Streptomyces sp. NPDC059913]|uniref:hypothetical protein n=1 Tax=unclassified Streptomyces TaxID=2593676 RepID=UPI003667F21C
MTIDAMHWVWTHSRAKGNARLVLLAVADKAPGPDCKVKMGTTEFIARLNAARSSVIKAVDSALASGELVIAEAAIGSRAATYQLPHAVGYVRPTVNARGPESGPVGENYRSGIETPNPEQGSGIRTGSETARGPESGPGGSEIETPMGPESGPLNQTTPTRSASKQEREPEPVDLGPQIPTNARPLVDALTAAGILVRWNLSTSEWFIVEALVKRTGVPALAAYAQKQAAAKDISYAKYFLPGWRELPPLPEPGAARPPLRAVSGGNTGWQPYTNPTDISAYSNGF